MRDLALRVDDLTGRLHDSLDRRTTAARHALAILRERMTPGRLAERLQALSPLAVLARGYAVCRTGGTGVILKDSAAVRTGDAVSVTLHRGSLG